MYIRFLDFRSTNQTADQTTAGMTDPIERTTVGMTDGPTKMSYLRTDQKTNGTANRTTRLKNMRPSQPILLAKDQTNARPNDQLCHRPNDHQTSDRPNERRTYLTHDGSNDRPINRMNYRPND